MIHCTVVLYLFMLHSYVLYIPVCICLIHICWALVCIIACVQRKERAEQVAYKLEQDLALCKYIARYVSE